MDCTVIVATFGDRHWQQLAESRAVPSAIGQAPVIRVHGPQLETYGASIAACRNQGAQQARSEWLCFLDADDELLPGFFGPMAEATGDLRTPMIEYIRDGKPDPPMFWPEGDLRDGNHLVICTLIRRAMFLAVGGFRDVGDLYEDWDLFQRCWKAGATIEQVPGSCCRVHINPESKHRFGTNRRQKIAAHEHIRRLNFPELYEADEIAA